MADDRIESPSLETAPGSPAPATQESAGNGRNGEAHRAAPAAPRISAEFLRMAGWVAGFCLVVVCGWGLLGMAYFLGRLWKLSPEWLLLPPAAAVSLGLFLVLQRRFWLSRLMSLPVKAGGAGWKSALLLWLLGPLLLLLRHTTDEASQAQAAARQAKASHAPQSDSVREVVETVVFVVVLVLMLKSFAAEAFVIPTGSMAETLWGYQKVVECPDCHIEFPINCSSEVDPTDGELQPVFACTCPNCRQHIYFSNAPRGFTPLQGSVQIPDPGWSSGDRVLVGKFVYDLLDQPPNRFDVVVFKYPGDNRFPTTGPYKNNVPMNYIKRCLGLPGEVIAVHRGNVYVLAPGKGPKYDDYEKARNDPEKLTLLWQKDPQMHVNDPRALELFDKHQFQILRKEPDTLLAMMRLVFDNDHPGKGQPERWQAGDGWQPEGRGFKIDGAGAGQHWLRYWHLCDRDRRDRRSLITDFMGYNTFVNYQHNNHHAQPDENWVNDLILECDVTLPDKPTGELTLELSRGVDRFRARWDLGSPEGLCTLYRVEGDRETKLGEARPTSLKSKGTYKVRFANVDERLTVWVDGRLPFDAGVTYLPAKEEGPQAENDLEPASIGVSKGATVRVSKLRVFRDTYYTANDSNPSMRDAMDYVDFGDPRNWGPLRKLRVLTMYVQPGHYLGMGDNSPESSDGRSWGLVPQRLLLGRAVLVYYPFSRFGPIR
jgi:signal peptidase I